MTYLFKDSLGNNLTLTDLVVAITDFIRADEKRRYKIIIGSDSEKHNGGTADFATAVVIHRQGCGGRYFWRRAELNKLYTLRERIIQEVLFSLEAAREILLVLKNFEMPEFDFEIHVDIGENGETKSMIQEVLGMIRAYSEFYPMYSKKYSFEARTKPESYAASKVADRHV